MNSKTGISYFSFDEDLKSDPNSLVEKLTTGKAHYYVQATRTSGNEWNVRVIVEDEYDFTECKICNEGFSMANLANDIAFGFTKVGVVGSYWWGVDYYVTMYSEE